MNNFSSKNRVEIEWKSFQLDPYAVTDPKRSSLQHLVESKGMSADQAAQTISFITSDDNFKVRVALEAIKGEKHRGIYSKI